MNGLGLSKTEISTFEGNVVTLQLLSDKDISKEDIIWKTSDESMVYIRDFKTMGEPRFSDGVLLVMLKKGNAEITAEFAGHTYLCKVESRELKKAKETDSFNFYFSDFHCHTSSIHKADEFKLREDGNPFTVLKEIRKDGFYDSVAIADHACLVDNKEFFNVFLAVEEAERDGFIAFAGTESEIENIEADRHGVMHKNAGEAVTFNSHGWAAVEKWDEYFEKTYKNPYATAIFNHPQINGVSVPGIWNFSFRRVIRPEMIEMFRMIEMGNGTNKMQNLIHERMYPCALDCGLRLSPACNGDWHGPVWDRNMSRGRNIIMAPEKDKEYFLDAVRNNRIVATENGKTMIWYTVNDKIAGSDLLLTDTYKFHVGISYLEKPVKGEEVMQLEVISDYGETVKKIPLNGKKDINILDFELKSNTARYFYLKVISKEGDRTWSSPVWTGRKFDEIDNREFEGIKIDKSSWKVISSSEGNDSSYILSDDTTERWTAKDTNAEFVIDMGKVHKLSAVGINPHNIPRKDVNLSAEQACASLISEFEIYSADEDMNFNLAYEGRIHCYGEEMLCKISECDARYIKLKILNTVGSANYKSEYMNAPVRIGAVYAYKNRN